MPVAINKNLLQRMVFPGGEVRIAPIDFRVGDDNEVSAVIKNSDDIMELFLATDAIRRMGFEPNKLYLPYFPYAREDRVFSGGSSLGVVVAADLINSLNYKNVTIVDPHSDVTPALLKNCRVITQAYVFNKLMATYPSRDFFLVSPDAGADKKMKTYANEFVTARKQRNVDTGEISGTEITIPEKFSKSTALIVDDICDGGKTFVELAKAIKAQYPNMPVHLLVTHGIFSKGLSVFDGLIEEIYDTNTLENQFWGDIQIRRVK